MLIKGALDVVRKYNKKFFVPAAHISANSIIGIYEIGLYLQKSITLKNLKDRVLIRTRQYAKRQFTWARGHMKSWETIYSSDINDLFEKTVNKIS